MDQLKLSSRLNILLALAATSFSILLLIALFGMNTLGQLQDAGFKKSSESAEMQHAATIGSVAYQVIADSIINRNLGESAKNWADIKTQAEKALARGLEFSDNAEEKQAVAKAQAAYRTLVDIYESKLLPLLRNDADLKDIRDIDGEMDAQIQILSTALESLAKSLAGKATEADALFDSTRSTTVWSSLIAALILFASMIAISTAIRRSIVRQLGGEPAYAMEVSRRIASGDLTTTITVENTTHESLMNSMKAMQEQLAHLIGTIHSSVAEVSQSAEELAAVSGQVSSRSLQQSDDTASVSAAIEQLTVSIDVVAGNARDAESTSAESGERSVLGAQQVKEATDEMEAISRTVSETSRQMAVLSEQSRQISTIINVIREVADQTNLLALNAAIEAARAGEQGRGFAVVADEVRKLAERTTASAQEISTTIASIQNQIDTATSTMQQGSERVNHGVVLAERAEASMQKISEDARSVVHAVTGISTSLGEQRTASSEIAARVENIAAMTEESSTAITQVAQTAGRLKSMAGDLGQAVSRFRV